MTQDDILDFMRRHPNQRFGPTEIARHFGIARGTTGKQMLALYKKGNLQMEKGEYWFKADLPTGLNIAIREWKEQLPFFTSHGEVNTKKGYRTISREEMVIDPLVISAGVKFEKSAGVKFEKSAGVKFANRGFELYRGQELPVENDPSFNKIFNSIWIPQGRKLKSAWELIKTYSKARKHKYLKKDLVKLADFLNLVVKLLDQERDDEIVDLEY